MVEALAVLAGRKSAVSGKRGSDDGDDGTHGWSTPAAAADLGGKAGPRAALKLEGKGRVSTGSGAHLDGGCAWDLSDSHVLHLDVDVSTTSSGNAGGGRGGG